LLLLAAGNAGADTLDLTGPVSDGGTGSTTSSGSFQSGIDFFTRTDSQATGSGVIQSFVRISAANQAIIQGYNTDARKTQFDENSSPTFTRHLNLSDIPEVVIDGVTYREFLLDINQNNDDPLLSLNELQIFVGNTGSPIGASVDSNGTLDFGSQASLIYDMDANADNTVELNYNLNSGSGSGDLFAYVKSSLFGTDGTQFVTLYSKFGDPNANNDGYEEWAVRTGTTLAVVPEPGTIALALSGALGFGLAGLRRLRRQKAAV